MKKEMLSVGPWACEKLECLKKYLQAYSTVLNKYNYKHIYVDAFAGSGKLALRNRNNGIEGQMMLDELAQDEGFQEYINGSPIIALETIPPFIHYVFIERNSRRSKELEFLQSQYPERNIHIRPVDCNDYLVGVLLKHFNPDKHRALVFLDPFGMQIPWSTIDLLGKTKGIEVLINYTYGMGIQRVLRNDGQIDQKNTEKLDQYFGSHEWHDIVYSVTSDMFSDTVVKNENYGDALLEWYKNRLKSAFGFVSKARVVRNTRGNPLYYLIHAGPNKTGNKIAEDILKQGEVV